MAKITEMTETRDEHPDDLAARLESEKYGRTHAKAFCDDHARDMVLLIETYADKEAGKVLEHLREMFWAETWKPKL